jgi:hypothetical protein
LYLFHRRVEDFGIEIDLTSCGCGGTCCETSFDAATESDDRHESDFLNVENDICPGNDPDTCLGYDFGYDFDLCVQLCLRTNIQIMLTIKD